MAWLFIHLSMVCPRIGRRGGGWGVRVGQEKENLTSTGYQMSALPPSCLHYMSNSHPWGPQIVFLIDTNLRCRIMKKLTQKYQKVRLFKSTTCHCLVRFATGFWIHLYVKPGKGRIRGIEWPYPIWPLLELLTK